MAFLSLSLVYFWKIGYLKIDFWLHSISFFFIILPFLMFCRLRCWHYDDPVVEEATNVLREWGVIWNRSFVVSWIQLLFLPLDGRHVVYFSSRKNTNNIKGKKKFLKQAHDVNIISAFFTVKLMRCVTLGAPVYRSVFFCTKNCLFLFSISPKLRLIFIKGHAIVSERKKKKKMLKCLGRDYDGRCVV